MKIEKTKSVSPYAYPGIPRYNISGTVSSTGELRAHLEDVKRLVCEVLKVDLKLVDKLMNESIRNASGKRKGSTEDACRTMHTCMFITYETTTVSLNDIGKVIGNRDHSTILYGIRKIEGLCEVYPKFRIKINTILFRMGRSQLPKKKWNLR